MKKGHIIELIIDALIVMIGLILSLFSSRAFPTVVYAGVFILCCLLEIIEFLFNKERKEALFMSSISLICFLFIIIVKAKINLVLACTVLGFSFLSLFVKVYSLKYIKKERTRLFSLRYYIISVFSLLGILISIALYYQLLTKVYLISLLFMCFGLQELFCDILMHVDEVKEVFKR